MPDLKTLGLLVALPGLMLSGAVPASAASEPKRCKVTVDRSQAKGVFDVQRQELENGDCICYAYTQPAPPPPETDETEKKPETDETEKKIAALLDRGQCPDAPLVAVPAAGAVAGGALGGAALPVLGVLGTGGIAAAAASGGDGGSSP